MTVEGVNGVNGPKDTYYVSGGGQTNQSETTTNVDMSQAKGNASDAGFEASGLSITKEDVKDAQDELGIRTSAKTKERVAAMRNEYAQKILSSCAEGCPPELKGVAMAYVQELPMASRGRDIQNFKAACEAKLDAFRGTAQRMGLGVYLMQMEENNKSRHNLAEVAADLRQTETELTVVQTGMEVIENINAHTDEVGEATQKIVKKEGQTTRAYTGRRINSAVGRINRHTTAVGNAVNAHTDAVGDQVTRNTGAMLGTPGVGETRTVRAEDGTERTVGVVRYSDGSTVDVERHDTALGRSDDNADRVTRNVGSLVGNTDVGEYTLMEDGPFAVTWGDGSKTRFAEEDTVNGHTTTEVDRGIKAINEHTTAEVDRGVKKVNEHSDTLAANAKLDRQQNAVLQSMRAGITDAIGHHERDNTIVGGIGFLVGIGGTTTTYQDSTIKWLSEQADAVMADSELTFDKKKAALTELRRMVEEEAIIDDSDRNKFVNTYLRESRDHRHI